MQWKFMEVSGVVPRRTDYILMAIQIFDELLSKNLIIVVAYPAQGPGNDVELLMLSFNQRPIFIDTCFSYC